MCVNLPPRLLANRGFVGEIEQVVRTSVIAPERLVLELTERMHVEDASAAFSGMRRLRALGIKLAIDDFGGGYSSLSQLRELTVDVLKLDRSLVEGIAGDSGTSLLARGILDLARALGKLVIAEGVERAEQARRLRELGCVLAQGYLFSPPLGADEIHAKLVAETSQGA